VSIALGGTPLTGTDGGGSASVVVTIPAGTIPDGSLVVAIHCNDSFDITNMVAPVLSSFSPTMNLWGVSDGGLNLSHVKVWAFDYPAGAAASSRTLTCTETGSHGEDKGLSVWWFSGAAAAASALRELVASGSPSVAQGTHVLTGLSAAAQSGDFLIGHIRTSNSAGTASFTPPGTMTEQYDISNFTHFTGANETLAASGATGTRTFTPASSVPWVGVLFAIAPAAAGAAADSSAPAATLPPHLVQQLAAQRAAQFAQPRAAATVTGTAVAALGGLSGTIAGSVTPPDVEQRAPFLPPHVVQLLAAQRAAQFAPSRGAITVTGTAAAALGGLSATAAATPTVFGLASATLGGVTATAVVNAGAVTGTAAAALGRATAAASGTVTHPATAAAALGRVAATATGTRTTFGTASAALGGLTATAVPPSTATHLAGELHGPQVIAAGSIVVHTGSIAGAIT